MNTRVMSRDAHSALVLLRRASKLAQLVFVEHGRYRQSKKPVLQKGMTYQDELKSISDDELLQRLSGLLNQSRRVESELVAHIGEVDERRLYARQAASSMFVSRKNVWGGEARITRGSGSCMYVVVFPV